MRKFIALLLVIILSLSLFGCSSKGDMGKTSSIVSNNNRNYLTAEDKDYIYFIASALESNGSFAAKIKP